MFVAVQRSFFLLFVVNFQSSDAGMPPTTTTPSPRVSDEYQTRHVNGGRRAVACGTDQIEYRLTKLEVQMAEKSGHLVSELREGNRRLQALEYQSNDVLTEVEGLKTEIGRLSDFPVHPVRLQKSVDYDNSIKLEHRLEDLHRGLNVVLLTLKGLHSDITWLKKNVSVITNSTSKLLQQYEDLATKQFLTHSLEMKMDRMYPQIPSNLFRIPSSNLTPNMPRNCKDVQDRGETASGLYTIQPDAAHNSFLALCNMETRGGGWTYIHSRYDGSQDFYRNWHDYKAGFGNLAGEFWLGLDHIYELTGHDINELLVELVDANNEKAYAHYAAFSTGKESDGYTLKVLGGYKGNAGDSLAYHAGSRFSTKDLDQDTWAEGNCAQSHNGAWWYRGCDSSNLNGRYAPGELPETYLYQGMYWGEFRGPQYSLAQARMMVRPRGMGSPPVFPKGLDESPESS